MPTGLVVDDVVVNEEGPVVAAAHVADERHSLVRVHVPLDEHKPNRAPDTPALPNREPECEDVDGVEDQETVVDAVDAWVSPKAIEKLSFPGWNFLQHYASDAEQRQLLRQ